MTSLSVIVVNFRGRDLLKPCLSSLLDAIGQVPGETEVLVVDNGSDDGSAELVRRDFPFVRLVELGVNLGFGAAANEGIRRSSGDWVALLNNDIVVEPHALRELLAVGVVSEDVGSVAAQIRFADRPQTINSAGIDVDRLGVAFDRLVGCPSVEEDKEPVEVFGASGAAALYRKTMIEQVGYFDSSFFLYLEDVDIAWRARQFGWKCLYGPAAIIYHNHSASAVHGSPLKYFLVGVNRARLLAKNMETRHLIRYVIPIVMYDAMYVAFVAVKDRTLAPLRGRVHGLREWRVYRGRRAPTRRSVALAPIQGLRAAMMRRSLFEKRYQIDVSSQHRSTGAH